MVRRCDGIRVDAFGAFKHFLDFLDMVLHFSALMGYLLLEATNLETC